MEQQILSTMQVANIAGVSLRQLQWWDEKRVVIARHVGHRRIYQTADAVDVALIAELRGRGISLQRIRRILTDCQKQISRLVDDNGNQINDGAIWLVVDSATKMARGSISIFTDSGRVLDFLKEQNNGQHLISLTDLLEAVRMGVRVESVTRKRRN